MFKWFNKNKRPKEMPYLEAYQHRHSYFVRTASWDWLNKTQIYVAAPIDGKPRMITMDFWPQEIFLDANGQITVEELIHIACDQLLKSNLDIPPNVDEFLISELESLVNDLSIVAFTDQKTVLPQKFDKPMSVQTANT